MFPERRRHDGLRRSAGFTMIEMLTVIVIIMIVMALALPDFVHMMKERKWVAGIANMQGMVMRARAFATNVRKDFAVEFNIMGDNGTTMWVESKSNLIEHLPDLNWLVAQYHTTQTAWDSHNDLLSSLVNEPGEWWAAGGTRTGSFPNWVFTLNPNNAHPECYGHASHQSEIVTLGNSLTIDDLPFWSPNFVNWDQRTAYTNYYGSDNTKDIRIGPNGALVQSTDPVICLRQIGGAERRKLEVIRCTGRLINPQ